MLFMLVSLLLQLKSVTIFCHVPATMTMRVTLVVHIILVSFRLVSVFFPCLVSIFAVSFFSLEKPPFVRVTYLVIFGRMSYEPLQNQFNHC